MVAVVVIFAVTVLAAVAATVVPIVVELAIVLKSVPVSNSTWAAC